MENETHQFQKSEQVSTQIGTTEVITTLPRLRKLGDTMTLHGTDMALSFGFMGEMPDSIEVSTMDARLEELKQKKEITLR